MNEKEFCLWLHGYFELQNPDSISETQTKIIRDHLALVFNKVTPERHEPKNDYIKELMEKLKDKENTKPCTPLPYPFWPKPYPTIPKDNEGPWRKDPLDPLNPPFKITCNTDTEYNPTPVTISHATHERIKSEKPVC